MKFLIFNLFLFCWVIPSWGDTRTSYFSQTGKNVTIQGAFSAVNTFCVISIANNSSQSQTFTLAVNAYSTGPGATGTVGASGNAGNPGGAGSSSGSGASTTITYTGVTIAAGANVAVYQFDYTTYPSNATVTSGTQDLICKGSLSASDSGTSPGFIHASGYIRYFQETNPIAYSNKLNTIIFQSVPILIEDGRAL